VQSIFEIHNCRTVKKIDLYILCILAIVLVISCKKEPDKKKPFLDIVSPENNYSVYKGEDITIVVNANDPDGLVETVDFKIDQESVFQSLIEPYIYSWNTNRTSKGIHKVSVIVTDNEGFTDSLVINVIIKTVDPEVLTLQEATVGTTCIVVVGNVTSLGIPAIFRRGFCWNRIGTPTINDDTISYAGEVSKGFFNNALLDLAIGTKYYIRSFVKNADTTFYGNEVTFTTYSSYFSDSGSFTDNRDLINYKWVKIGNQTWMAENLKYRAAGIQAYYTMEDSLKYGYLYNSSSANSSCPVGWHLPDKKEWAQLIYFVGGFEVAGSYLKKFGVTGWSDSTIDESKNSFFSAMPGGTFFAANILSRISAIGTFAEFWYRGETDDPSRVRPVDFSAHSNAVGIWEGSTGHPDSYYFSVRCIKD
jgi:uncharacterized protein (TIGR02145 family)